MGTTKFVRRLSLRGQVIVTLLFILVSSWLATVLTFGALMGLGAVTGHSNHKMEKQLTALTAEDGANLLSVSEEQKISQVLHGVSYQVVNAEGQIVYGSIRTPILHNRIDLLHRINTTEVEGHSAILLFNLLQSDITRYFPLLDHSGRLQGALIVQVPIRRLATDTSTQGFATFLSYLLPFIPFLYFCLFSYLFAKRFGKRIGKPLQVLMRGAERIQSHDLDFEIEASGPNEIRQVLVAFENMRAALKESLVRQWQMEDERRHMIASISHDLRTPVTIIQGHVEGLLDGGMERPERRERYLETVLHNTKRVVQLIEDMQHVTEVEKPDFSLRPVPVDLYQYFSEWTGDFELLTSRAEITLRTDFQDTRDEKTDMLLDPERISQILDNIASNSVRFTPRGGVITIGMTVLVDRIVCEIADTGKGFSKTDLQHMFDRFYQGDVARGEAGHSGLGLYTARHLVEKHGGSITATNSVDGGAIVRFTLREHAV